MEQNGWQLGEIAGLGRIAARWDQQGRLAAVLLGKRVEELADDSVAAPLDERLADALTQYVRGNEAPLRAIALAPAATAFASQVRKALMEIPRGEVATYGQVAKALGRPGAARAVGAACRANPVPIVVPCHRVVGAGRLGGYAPGTEWKRMLLKLEGFDLGTLPRE